MFDVGNIGNTQELELDQFMGKAKRIKPPKCLTLRCLPTSDQERAFAQTKIQQVCDRSR